MRLPSILKDLIPTESVKQWMELVSQPNLVANLKDAAQQMGLKEAWGSSQLQQSILQAKTWLEMFQDRWREGNQGRLQLGINATGLLFSTRWTSVPLASSAISMQAYTASGYSSPQSLHSELQRTLQTMTGAEACLVTSSLEQAILLAAQSLPTDLRWGIPRADCVRLASGADVASLLSHQRRPHIELGATNACTLRDYQQAVTEGAGGFFHVRPARSSESITDAEFASLPRSLPNAQSILHIEVLLDGSCIDLSSAGLMSSVSGDRLRHGQDAVILPGDGWIGGPTCGLILGKARWLQTLKDLGQQQGMLACPSTIATLHASLSAGMDCKQWRETPLGAMAGNGLENLMHRAKRLGLQLEGISDIAVAEPDREFFPIADSPLENLKLESGCVRVEFRNLSPREAQAKLLQRETPIWAMAGDNHLTLVMRSIEPADDNEIVQTFEALFDQK